MTENFADYASLAAQNLERDAPHGLVAFVRKSDLPSGSALGPGLARRLDAWVDTNPSPSPGSHWP